MTAPPTLRAEIAFETGANPAAFILGVSALSTSLAPATVDIWTDVTADVRRLSINRGKSRELDAFQAGRCILDLDNVARDYDPLNLSGPYVSGGATLVKPGRRLRVYATHPVTLAEEPLFNGVIRDWAIDYSGGFDSRAQAMASDSMVELANTKVAVTTSAAASGTPVGEILDAAGVSARDIDTGNNTMQSMTFSGTALAALRVIEQSEQGNLFIECDGLTTFLARHAIDLDTERSTSQATFGAGNLEIETVDVAYESDVIKNHAIVTRQGGSAQEASDDDSVAEYGERQLSLSGMALASDPDALILAQYLIADRAEPQVRVKGITIAPQRHDDLMTQALSRRLIERVTVSWTPPGAGSPVTAVLLIIGIEHNYTPPAAWSTKFAFGRVPQAAAWLLGVGELGDTSGATATVLGY